MISGGVSKFRGSLLIFAFSACFELSALISAFKGEFFGSGGVVLFSAVLYAFGLHFSS
jgi:hypothetical protein